MLFISLLLTALPLSWAFADPVVHERARSRSRQHHANNKLAKRQTYSGTATFYDVGLGACGGYNVASDYIVALNAPMYGSGYPGPNCGRSITITANGVSVVATIADQCPGCGYGSLDLSRGLFTRFASEDQGTFQMSWHYNDGSSDNTPTTTHTTEAAPTSTATPTPTYTPPTSTYTPPASTSTSTEPPASSAAPTSTSVAASVASSISVSSLVPSGSASVSVDPFVVTSNSTASATGSAAAAAASGSNANIGEGLGNLVLFNQAVTYLGNIVVVGASQ